MAGLSLTERLAALDEAVALGGTAVPPSLSEDAARVTARAGERLRLSERHTVVALAGATGSGKSSLTNALVGKEIARVDVRRPTTAHALAAVSGAEGVDPLLDWLGVRERVDLAAPMHGEGLVLLDLPDHDSVEVAHRLEAERLVELVDLMVWVLDPQKYADEAVHRYLRALARHAGVMLVVLNQVDRLDAADRAAALADLRRLLATDGLAQVPVLAVSARTGEGVEALRQALEAAASQRVAARTRMEADVAVVADRLVAACATGRSAPVASGPDAALVEAFGQAAGVPRVVAAVRGSWVREARRATGWPPTRWLAGLRADPMRRLHLGRRVDPGHGRRAATAEVPVAPDHTSLPPAGPAQVAQAHAAARRWTDAATTGLPDDWVVLARAEVGTLDRLSDDLDRAVAGAALDRPRRPLWWSALGLLQGVLLATTLVGGLWLLALMALGALALAVPDPPRWGEVPVPTLALVGGALAGLLVAGLGRLLASVGGRRAARRATSTLRTAVAEVARHRVTDPVTAVVDRHLRCREAALRAAGPPARRRDRGAR
ncbi:GTPase [Actinotalea sp.]|uniref:GTPase n=1 Tax=Actinotalea sp. TaxID=1872145 RepID=UPI00356A412A